MKKVLDIRTLIIALALIASASALHADRGYIQLQQGMNCGYLAPVTGNSATIELWIMPAVNTGNIISNQGNNLGFNISYDGWARYFIGGRGSQWFDPTSWINTWTHIALVMNNSTSSTTMYVNGIAVGKEENVTPAYPGYDPSSALWLGIAGWGGVPYTGKIADVRIWNSARTMEEIKSNMHKIIDPQTPKLVLNYSFSEGEGEQTANTSSSEPANIGWVVGGANNATWGKAALTPTALSTSGITANGFTISWNAGNEASYRIALTDSNGKTTHTDTKHKSHTFTALTASSYTVKVMSLLPFETEYSAPISITLGVTGTSASASTTPARLITTTSYWEIASHDAPSSATLYNSSGATIQTITSPQPMLFQHTNLSSGVYYIRINNQNGITTLKAVK